MKAFKVEPFVIDGDDKIGFTYSVICGGEKCGKVDKDGIYTADKSAKAGDTVAVVARLDGVKSYGVAVISIV